DAGSGSRAGLRGGRLPATTAHCRTAPRLQAGIPRPCRATALRRDGPVAPARRRRHSRCRAVRPGRRCVLFGLGPVGEEAAGLPAHRYWSMPRPWPAVGVRPIYPLLTAPPEVLILWVLAAIGDSGGSVCVASLGAWQSRWSLPNSSDSSGNRRRDLPEENTEVCCFGAVIGCIGAFVAIRTGGGGHGRSGCPAVEGCRAGLDHRSTGIGG